MGILNVTPDSFSDGGEFNTLSGAMAQVDAMVAAGVDIVDVGGQSTRPGAEIIDLETELARTIPLIKAIRDRTSVPISIDTTRAEVARSAIAAGADLINDVSGATYDPEMLPTAGKLQTPIVLMHLRGTPQTMQSLTQYEDLIAELLEFFEQRLNASLEHGLTREQVIIDPGIGFAKTAAQNIELLRQNRRFQALGLPILVGPSRKSFIGKILNRPDPKDRLWGTAAACCAAIANGADIVRVHDVMVMVEVCRVADRIWRETDNLDLA
ncbi:MAG: dihydropteroate synthase [Cyanobacteria bacterium P01_H01_bin.15]